MNIIDGKVSDLNIAYIGGGSRGWARGLMSDLASNSKISGNIRLYDIDMKAAKENETIGNRFNSLEGANSEWDYKAVETYKEALIGADFVVISILPGTFDEMESDVHSSEKYGIYQSTGDTVGAAGTFRALRSMPMFAEFAQAIKDYAPNAWVINYTNPMTLCIRTMYEVFPQIKAFGCCHEVFGTQKVLAKAIKEFYDIEEEVKREDIYVNVLGINHFTWFDKASYKHFDVWKAYEKYIDKYYEGPVYDRPEKNESSTHQVKMDLFKKYGLIAAAGDRHLTEFVPNPWYSKSPEMAKAWNYELVQVSGRKKGMIERLEKTQKILSGEKELELKKTGEEGVKLIRAILGFENLISNVNIPNRGQISNLPLGAIVETNALFNRDNLQPIFAGKIPDNVNSIIHTHVSNQETLIKAFTNKDLDIAFSAFINDPQLAALTMKDTKQLFSTMYENTKEYLGCYKQYSEVV